MDSAFWFDAINRWDSPLYISRGVMFKFSKFVFCLKIFFTFTNSVDPNEMQHHAAIHLGLHCLQKLLVEGFPKYRELLASLCSHKDACLCPTK